MISVSRRMFLKSAAAGAAALAIGVPVIGAAAKKPLVGLQLYSVRADMGKDFEGTIAAVAKIGYKHVEFAGYFGKKAEDIRKVLDANGLVCSGTHIGLGTMKGDALKGTVDFHKTLGCNYLIVPGGIAKEGTKQAWLDAAKEFNEVAERLKECGMCTGYHNHSHEFKPFDGGETPWEVFYSNTSPQVVHQIDTGNCLGGKGDPVAMIKKFPGRTKIAHLKEHGGPGDFGKGDTKWKDVFDACEAVGGTEFYTVEQERYAQPPIDAVRQCFEFMKEMGKA